MVSEVLTVGKIPDGRTLAVITTGGHPQLNPDETANVLAVEVVKSMKEAKQWFRKMQAERPWETRQ